MIFYGEVFINILVCAHPCVYYECPLFICLICEYQRGAGIVSVREIIPSNDRHKKKHSANIAKMKKLKKLLSIYKRPAAFNVSNNELCI